MHYFSADVPREIGSRLWSALIAPRPVFLIVSQNELGQNNIAAYSSVALVSTYPPVVTISFGKRNGRDKNTFVNIMSTKHFSINAVPRRLAETANRSAEGTEMVEDFVRLGLTANQFERSPAVATRESPASIACELLKSVEIEGSSSTLVLARCNEIFAEDRYLAEGLFNPIDADLIGSVGLEEFITVKGEAFVLPRTWE